MDVNEHERLSNVTLKTQIKVKKKTNIFTAVLHFKVTVVNNENNSYHKMSLKRSVFVHKIL
jgi:hypothetical protein